MLTVLLLGDLGCYPRGANRTPDQEAEPNAIAAPQVPLDETAKADPASLLHPVADVPAARPAASSPGSEGEPLPTLGEARKLPQDDPAADGWQTELFSRQAEEQLKKLGQLLTQPERASSAILPQLATPQFSARHVVPPAEVVWDDGLFQVHRWTSDLATDPNEAELVQAHDLQATVEGLHQAMQDFDQRHTKFKLFRVIDQESQIVTQQYFHLSGRSSHQRREINATWTIGWSRGTAQSMPQMQWLRVEEFEQVTVQADEGTPLLVDCTASLLKSCDLYHRGLLQGIGQWRKLLERHQGVYNFGHHGLAVGDVNGDGLEDLYVCQTGGIPNHLLLQQPDGTLRDAAAAAGVDYLDNTRSCLLIDLDNDNDQDLVVALTTGLLLLQNDGHGRFTERARIASVRQAFSLAAADYDQNGFLDLYVCVYYGSGAAVSELPVPVPYFDATNGGANYLIHNQGNWQFRDVTGQVGLQADNQRYSFAAAWEDVDNDGDPDLMVVNDFGPNHLYLNTGGRFEQIAQQAGLLDGAFGMSATWGDYDHDGRMDLYVSNMFSAAGSRVTFQPRFKPELQAPTKARFQHLARGNSLFRNTPGLRFDDVSVPLGVTMGRWSWASLFVDLNNDSWEDLLVTNGFLTGESPDDL